MNYSSLSNYFSTLSKWSCLFYSRYHNTTNKRVFLSFAFMCCIPWCQKLLIWYIVDITHCRTFSDSRVKIGQETHSQDNIIRNHFKLTPFFTDSKILLWTQHYMLTHCGRTFRFIESYFIANDMLTPLVARQLFQTIQKTKKYQLELFFF